MSAKSEGQYRFPTTHWSLIGRAGQQTDAAWRDALDQLLRIYWPALRAHLVIKRRIDPDQADDLLQSFVESKVLEKNLIAHADQRRGKFRTLLATALDNFVANQWQRQAAKKRSVERASSLDGRGSPPPVASVPGKDAFDVVWAQETIAETLRRMQSECDASGRQDIWEIFVGRVSSPILEGAEPLPYDEIVRRFGFRSPAQASNALVTAKRTFVRILRSVVSEYAASQADVESEICDLINVLSA